MDQKLVEKADHLRHLKASEGGKLLFSFIMDKRMEIFDALTNIATGAKMTNGQLARKAAQAAILKEIVEFVDDGIRHGDQERGNI